MNFPIQSEFYGDDFRWFFARVIDGSPPYGLEGRVKIRIMGVHSGDVEEIPQSDLPWAQVMLPSTAFGSSGFGPVPQILPGALVFGVFIDGKQSQLPLVLGSVPKIEYPSSVQADAKQDITTNSFAYEYVQSNFEGIDPNARGLSVDNVDQRQTIAFEFFLNNGYTLQQSCAITGTLMALTEMDPTFDDGTYYGIGAWQKNSRRFTRLNRFSTAFQPSKTVESFDLQLQFVLNELRTTRTIAQCKIIATENFKGTADGTRIDSREVVGNGGCAAMYKYYLTGGAQSLTSVSEAEARALLIYNGAI